MIGARSCIARESTPVLPRTTLRTWRGRGAAFRDAAGSVARLCSWRTSEVGTAPRTRLHSGSIEEVAAPHTLPSGHARRPPSPRRCLGAAAAAHRAAPAPDLCRPAASPAERRRRPRSCSRCPGSPRDRRSCPPAPTASGSRTQSDRVRVREPLPVEAVQTEHVAVVGEEHDDGVVQLPARRDRIDDRVERVVDGQASRARCDRPRCKP
jgi:hypothetical protein